MQWFLLGLFVVLNAIFLVRLTLRVRADTQRMVQEWQERMLALRDDGRRQAIHEQLGLIRRRTASQLSSSMIVTMFVILLFGGGSPSFLMCLLPAMLGIMPWHAARWGRMAAFARKQSAFVWGPEGALLDWGSGLLVFCGFMLAYPILRRPVVLALWMVAALITTVVLYAWGVMGKPLAQIRRLLLGSAR